MESYDYMADVLAEPVPQERAPVPPINKEVVLEVRAIEEGQTKDGLGVNIKLECRVGTKPWSGRKVFDRLFVKTSDPDKQKGASINRAKFRAIIDSCGFVDVKAMNDALTKNPADKTALRQKRSLELGVAQPIDETFNIQKLVGRFFKAFVSTPEPTGEEKTYPKIAYVRYFDPEQYNEEVQSCDFSRRDDAKEDGEVPPF